MRYTQSLAVALSAVTVVFVAGCAVGSGSGSGVAAKSVTLPVILPLTGPASEYGIGDKSAMNLALNKINKDGGIDGKKLEVKIYNSEGTAATASEIVRGLLRSSLLVLGPNLSATAQAAFPILNAAGVPTITSSVSDATIMSANRPWTYDVFLTTTGLEASAVKSFLASHSQVKHMAAIIDDQNDASASQAKQMTTALAASGVTITKTIDVGESAPGYSQEANLVKSENPDAVMVSGYPNTAGAVIKSLRSAGVTQPVLFTTTSVTPDSLKIGGSAMSNAYAVLEYWPGLTGAVGKTFATQYEAANRGQTPEPTAPFMYDTMMLAADVLRASGVAKSGGSLASERAAIKKALSGARVTGAVTGDFAMQASGTRSGDGVWIQVDAGKVVAGPKGGAAG